MALSFKLVPCLFFFMFMSANVFARDFQFFSKVTTTATTTTPETTVAVKDADTETVEIPNTVETNDKPEEEPSFTQDTQNDNHGLYGTGKGEESSSSGLGESLYATQATGAPFEYQTGHYENAGESSDNNADSFSDENSKKYDSSYEEGLQHQQVDDKFVQESLQENVDASESVNKDEFSDKEQKDEDDLVNNNLQGFPSSTEEKNNYGYQQQEQKQEAKVEDGYVPESTAFQNQYTGNENYEKQGMSDTRYLSNGRYYYNVQDNQKSNEQGNQYDTRSSGYNYNDQVTSTTGYHPYGQFHP